MTSKAALVAPFVALVTAGCGGTLDAGRDVQHGLLPIDDRNPAVLVDDGWTDNWAGEYAVLLANDTGPSLAGIIIGASNYWPDLNANAAGWTKLVNAARASGLDGIPDVTVSAGVPLAAPDDGNIDSTVPNDSAGAERILELSRELGRTSRPLVILAGAALTDVADAYLIDPTVVDRVVVVAALGSLTMSKALMTGPNGDLDPWADWIVAHRFKYIQISAFYDQTEDVTPSQLQNLPASPLGNWMAAKQSSIMNLVQASDQVTVLSAALPQFVVTIQRSSPDTTARFGSPQGQGPPLLPDDTGNAWVVEQIATPLAASTLWRLLLQPRAHGS